MFAISTSWNSSSCSDAKEILSEIKEVGFSAIEVGHNFTSAKIEQLFPLVDIMGIKVVSVHNFCPLPFENVQGRHPSDCYRLSSLDISERQKAIDYTKRTIDTAYKFAAKAVVIHAGTVELEENYVGKLLRLYNEGNSATKEYLQIKDAFLKARENKKKPYLEAAIKSLDDILSYVSPANIKMGLENRYYPNEIPNFEEVDYLLSLFNHKGLVYWHDIGHAAANERLGFASHDSYYTRYSEYMFGMHIHDLKGINDHLAPFSGEFDFLKIAPYMKKNLIKVIEVNSQAFRQEIRVAIKKLQQLV